MYGIAHAAVSPVAIDVGLFEDCITFRPVFIVGLTGGVGSGKSTVAGFFTDHGAFLIDADQVAREVVGPKSAGLAAIEQRFGSSVLTHSGELDRAQLAELVFSDEKALSDLNAIVHPLVRARIEDQLEELRVTWPDAVVILMVPLLIESGAYRADVIVVIDTDEEASIRRLENTRGWTRDHALARMKSQVSNEERKMHADLVIENKGSLQELRAAVEDAWAWIQSRAARADVHLPSPSRRD